MRVAAPRAKKQDQVLAEVLDMFIGDDLAPTIVKLRQKISERRRGDLTFFYEVGTMVKEALDKVATHGIDPLADGEIIVNSLEDAIGLGTRMLYSCLWLVRRYDKAAFEDLCSHPEITPTHAMQLAVTGIPELRHELERKIVEEHLSVKDTRRAIEAYMGGPRRKPGGAGRQRSPATWMRGSSTSASSRQ
jgi:hypothetical protein